MRIASIFAFFCLLVLTGSEFVRWYDWHLEDAYIVYRIVRNLLGGEGWTFNPGEVHNASTSVLNTALIAAAAYFIGDIPLTAHILGALWIFLSGMLTFVIFRERFTSFAALTAGAAAVVSLANNLSWGLENHLFSFLVLLFVYFESRRKNSWPLLGLIVLARPDGMLMVAFKMLSTARGGIKEIVKGLLQTALILSPWLIFSLWQFGQFFPDTLSNKMWQGRSGFWGNGFVYWNALKERIFPSSWQLSVQGLYFSAALGSIILGLHKSPILYLIAFALAQQLAYIILNVPGYHWYFATLSLAAYIAAAYLAAVVYAALTRSISGKPLQVWVESLLLIAVGVVLTHLATDRLKNPVAHSGNIHYLQAISEIEASNVPDGELAALEVGTLGYHTKRPIFDLIGLTSANPQFLTGEHNDIFFERLPRIVVLHDPLWPMEQALFDDIRFSYHYGDGIITGDQQNRLIYYGLEREDRVTVRELEQFVGDNYSQPRPAALDLSVIGRTDRAFCTLDFLNGRLVRGAARLNAKQAVLKIQGWAFDPQVDGIAPEVQIVLAGAQSGHFIIPAERLPRPDVAEHFGRLVGEDKLGFRAEAALLELPPGRYRLYILQVWGAKKRLCPLRTRLIIGAGGNLGS